MLILITEYFMIQVCHHVPYSNALVKEQRTEKIVACIRGVSKSEIAIMEKLIFSNRMIYFLGH